MSAPATANAISAAITEGSSGGNTGSSSQTAPAPIAACECHIIRARLSLVPNLKTGELPQLEGQIRRRKTQRKLVRHYAPVDSPTDQLAWRKSPRGLSTRS